MQATVTTWDGTRSQFQPHNTPPLAYPMGPTHRHAAHSGTELHRRRLRGSFGIALFCALVGAAWGVALPAASAGQGGTPLDPRVEDALVFGEWEKVMALLDHVDAAHPSPVLRLIKGHASLATNRNDESWCLFASVVASDDLASWANWATEFARTHESATAVYLLGDALARRGQYDQAIAVFTQLLTKERKHGLALNARGVTYAAIGETNAAFNDFSGASDAAPGLADTRANLGALALQLKEGARGGIRDYSQAIELSSDAFPLALYGRGCLRIAASDFKLAQDDLDQASSSMRCGRSVVLQALMDAQKSLDGPDEPSNTRADAAAPGFAVSGATLDKFSRGDYGFSGWGLQNALKNAKTPAEISAITTAVNRGLLVNPGAGAAVARDYNAVENWARSKGALSESVFSWRVNGQGAGAGTLGGASAAAGKIQGSVGNVTFRDYSSMSQQWKTQADAIGSASLFAPAGTPQGFKAEPPLARDRGDWPFKPLYGLAYAFTAEPLADSAINTGSEWEGIRP